jgi:hypothetical protein
VLAARELAVDERGIDLDSGGNAFQDRGQARAMGLTGGQESETHVRNVVTAGDLTLDVASGDLTLDVASGDLTP